MNRQAFKYLLIFSGILLAGASALSGQKKNCRLSLHSESISVEEALSQIGEQCDVEFAFSPSLIPKEARLSLNITDMPLEEALKEVLGPPGLKAHRVGDQVVIQPDGEMRKLTGRITDGLTGEALPGVSISLQGRPEGALTDAEGEFRLAWRGESGPLLEVRMIGYKKYHLRAPASGRLDLALEEEPLVLEDVIVVSDQLTDRNSLSNMSLDDKDLSLAQGVSEDPIRTLTTMPGIGGGEGLAGPGHLIIRGGAPMETMYLLDNARLYFPYYLFGKSVFNLDMIEDVEVLTGGFPATYGKVTSGILNFRTRTGDMEQMRASAGLSLMSTTGHIEVPIKKKASLIVGLRKSTLDGLAERTNLPWFYWRDFSFKFTYRIDAQDIVHFSGMASHEYADYYSDSIYFLDRFNTIKTDRKVGTLNFQWQRHISERWYSKLSLISTTQGFSIYFPPSVDMSLMGTSLNLRQDFTFLPKAGVRIKTGMELDPLQYGRHGYRPLDSNPPNPLDSNLVLVDVTDTASIAYAGAWFMYEGDLLKRLRTNAGMRFDTDLQGTLTVEPRLALTYQLGSATELRGAWGIYHQYPDPAEIDTRNLKPSKSLHYIVGLSHRLPSGWNFWTEAYYKDYPRLVILDTDGEYRDDGEGFARGLEVFAEKTQGTVQGWLSYTLSQSRRQDDLQGQVFDFRFDRRHMLNLNLSLHLKARRTWQPDIISVRYRFQTGQPYTPIIGSDIIGGDFVFLTGDTLSARMPNYHNLRFRLEWNKRFLKKENHRLHFFIEWFNFLGNLNPSRFAYDYPVPGGTELQVLSLKFSDKAVPSFGLKWYLNPRDEGRTLIAP